MRRNYLTKSISIILMLLAMLFSCDQPTDVGSNNSNQQTSENQSQGNQNGENTGTEDNKDDVVTTGKIVGKATYTNTANHAGIQVTLVSTDGIVAYDSQISSRSRSAVAVMKNVVTSESGEYSFDNVKEGVYTIYASSDDSTEKAVLTNVVVQSNQVVTAADLNLTATGSICGRVTLDSKEDENLGITVVIAGTSYMAVTDSFGFFTISDIPAGSGYQIVIMKGDYCTIWKKESVEAGKENNLGEKNITSQKNPTVSPNTDSSFIWQGSFAVSPANPEKYWAYFNTTDGCSYIYDGEKWTLLAQAGKDGANGNGGGASVEHKITYELNGGTNSPYNPNLFLEYLTVNLNSPTRDGWYFDGWYENADFSGNRIKGWEIGEKRNDVTLYAKWGESSNIFLSGLNGANWAANTNIGNADAMTKGENDVWTFTFTAESAQPFPYGFKFTTGNGWMEQYQAYDKNNPTTDCTVLQPNQDAGVYFATKAELEAKDEDGNYIISDIATIYAVEDSFIVGNEYTITFDQANMKVKITGEFAQKNYITVTITIDADAKLILTDVPVYTEEDNTFDGAFFSWCGGTAQAIEATDCAITADWADDADKSWLATECPKDAVAGADAWAKLICSAGGEGWIPYSTTGEFTYSWANKK